MKISQLINQRHTLLRQMRLANLAFAYGWLVECAARAARAGLRGEVQLLPASPENGHPVAVFRALEGSQSVIEEHFTDEDLLDLEDALAYALDLGDEGCVFAWEELAPRFIAPVRRELERAGVSFDNDAVRSPDTPAAPG